MITRPKPNPNRSNEYADPDKYADLLAAEFGEGTDPRQVCQICGKKKWLDEWTWNRKGQRVCILKCDVS